MRGSTWAVTLLALLLGGAAAPMALGGQANLLLIIADDCTYRDMEVYGGQARTPNLNTLAEEGMTFSRCFQAAPMCSPTRHCLYTGLYPVKSGAYPNHTMAYDWVKSIAHYLQDAGYRTHLSGKTHIQPKTVFPFEYSARQNNPDMAAVRTFLGECSKSNTPFLLIAASNEPHTPWNKGDPSKYPPASLKLPPVLADTAATRRGFSKYLAEITYFDDQVGQLLALLDESGQRDNTLVVVLSEQGNSLPFAKWTCYDAGLQSGCIVRWPGRVQPASRSEAMIEYVDVVPTFLDAAGLPKPAILDGRSFMPVLTGATNAHKSQVFGLQTTRCGTVDTATSSTSPRKPRFKTPRPQAPSLQPGAKAPPRGMRGLRGWCMTTNTVRPRSCTIVKSTRGTKPTGLTTQSSPACGTNFAPGLRTG